jgi:uncharacterized protein (TIGR02001 family)
MRLNKLALALCLAALALPMSAMAQDAAAASEAPASNLSWNVELNSDYVFRGITQTDFDPALQGGLDYAFGDSGWFAGTWLSNVKFGTDTALEYDTYFGWAGDVNDDVNISLMFDRYNYSGEDVGQWDFNELIGKVTIKKNYALTLAYSNDWANSGTSSLYTQLTGTWALPNDFSLNAGVGHTNLDSSFSSDYSDYNIGISRQFGPVNAALNYYDTSYNVRASDSVVLTFKFGG